MQAPHWDSTFVPAARAVWPQVRRLRTAPGDPPTPLERPGPLASTFVGLFGNALALAATGALLCGECIEIHGGFPRPAAHDGAAVLAEEALGMRQLLAQQAWRDMDVHLTPAGEVDLWPVLEPWLGSVRDLPDGSRILPESLAPYWTVNALIEGEVLSANHAVALAQLLSAAAPAPPARPPRQEVRP